ncbi:ribonuclease III [Candidatus Sumerlaeota bacterium]|nr:ribonuclease III [Candidatus Sumerlaeota bacterium]
MGSDEESLPKPDSSLSEERLSQLRAFFNPLAIEPHDWDLINLAFTHSSHAFEQVLPQDNERLEFLGDAVIGLLVSLHLFSQREGLSEGDLSKLKAQLVSRNVLGRLALDMGIGEVMLLGRGEEQTGGRKRLSLLGSALEALVGAIYLDQGLSTARSLIAPTLLHEHDTITQHEAYQDYKSQLQEAVQRLHGTVPRYETLEASGPDHDKTFRVAVKIQGVTWGIGTGRRVKSAENRAARAALERIEVGSGGSGGSAS